MTADNLYYTAVHEAGHAVIGRVLSMLCGPATIGPDQTSAGAAHVADPYAIHQAWEEHGKYRDFRSVMIGRIITFMAGAEAEVAFGGPCLEGDWDDRLQIALMLDEVDADFPETTEARLRQMARALVRKHSSKIKIVARALLQDRSLSAEQLDSMVLGSFCSPNELG